MKGNELSLRVFMAVLAGVGLWMSVIFVALRNYLNAAIVFAVFLLCIYIARFNIGMVVKTK